MCACRGLLAGIAQAAGLDLAGVDRGLLGGCVCVQQVGEVIGPGALMCGDEPVSQLPADGSCGVQMVVIQPPAEERFPRQPRCGPLGVQLGQPGSGLARVAQVVAKAPPRGCPVESLRDPLDDDEDAMRAHQLTNVIKHQTGIGHVVQGDGGDDRVRRIVWPVVLESDPLVCRALRRLRVDARGLIAEPREGRYVPAGLPAAELNDGGRWWRQLAADERPRGCQPDFIRRAMPSRRCPAGATGLAFVHCCASSWSRVHPDRQPTAPLARAPHE